ncbi:uncharacterized protein [Clytia hemisphaerica]
MFVFYVTLSMVTINCRGNQLIAYCQDSCFTKLIVLILSNLAGFLFPFTRQTMESLFHIFLVSSALFLFVMFFTYLDCAHAFRIIWLRKARRSADEPTCYLCTWLFLIHLTTAFLYAISLDLILAFFFFNKLEQCLSTIVFLGINICLCLICCTISYFPNLRQRESSSQIVFATLFCSVSYVTWIALSDPENEHCNMYGTIFTGSILESSTSFRSLASLTMLIPVVLYQCLKKTDTSSYTLSLLIENAGINLIQCFDNFIVHISMATASAFVLMSVTNSYEPVLSIVETLGSAPKSSVVYFEGYNRIRFLLFCAVSSLLPICYLLVLLYRVVVTLVQNCKQYREEQRRMRENGETASTVENGEFVYIRISFAEAVRQLQLSRRELEALPYNQNETTLQYLLLQCFYITGHDLAYWHFPRHISQTYFKGRNGSNACTVISMIVGRFFARSDLAFQNDGYLNTDWLNLIYTAIEDGNRYYDTLIKEVGVLDLSIEEVYERLGPALNVALVHPSLPISFEAEVETATIIYQLKQLLLKRQKMVCLFIHKKRTSSFLIYETGQMVYVDSHAFGENGALMVSSSSEDTLQNLLIFLRDILCGSDNQLATLTIVDYEKRKTKENMFYK